MKPIEEIVSRAIHICRTEDYRVHEDHHFEITMTPKYALQLALKELIPDGDNKAAREAHDCVLEEITYWVSDGGPTFAAHVRSTILKSTMKGPSLVSQIEAAIPDYGQLEEERIQLVRQLHAKRLARMGNGAVA